MIQVVVGDITRLGVDVIVNAANSSLLEGQGSSDHSMYSTTFTTR